MRTERSHPVGENRRATAGGRHLVVAKGSFFAEGFRGEGLGRAVLPLKRLSPLHGRAAWRQRVSEPRSWGEPSEHGTSKGGDRGFGSFGDRIIRLLTWSEARARECARGLCCVAEVGRRHPADAVSFKGRSCDVPSGDESRRDGWRVSGKQWLSCQTALVPRGTCQWKASLLEEASPTVHEEVAWGRA